MATREIPLPDIGDFDEVDVIEVLIKEGDSIEKEQSLLTLESEKATMEVPAPFGGTVKEIKVKEGDKVSEGDVIAVVETDTEGDAESDDQEEKESEQEQKKDEPERESKDEKEDEGDADREKRGEEEQEEEKAKEEKPASGEGPREPPVAFDADDVAPDQVPHASPAVRRFARELGVNLEQVEGSGRKGRITKEDVQKHVKRAMEGRAPAAGAGLAVAEPPKVDFEKYGEVETQPLSRIRRISGANLHRNWVTVPHVTQHDEADITELEAFRKNHQKQAESEGAKLTLVSFLIKASVAALKRFPQFNASLDETGERLILKKYFHIGVAVDTENGLVVPVLRDCDRKGLLELAKELGEVSQKARDGKLSPGDMKGGCFSISSLGGIGGTAFTPIVNMPEVAILGVSRTSMKPVWDGDEFRPRLMLPLSLSYDHRVIDGADAARFTRYLAEALTDLRRILL